MGYYLAIPILLAAVAVQSSVVPQFRIFSGQPDLVLLLVLAWAVHADLEEGLMWAFFGGISQDLMSYLPLGASALGLVVGVFTIYGVRRQIFQLNIIVVVAIVMIMAVLQQIIQLGVLTVTGWSVNLISVIRYALIPSLFYNLALILPVYLVVRLIQRRIYRRLERV